MRILVHDSFEVQLLAEATQIGLIFFPQGLEVGAKDVNKEKTFYSKVPSVILLDKHLEEVVRLGGVLLESRNKVREDLQGLDKWISLEIDQEGRIQYDQAIVSFFLPSNTSDTTGSLSLSHVLDLVCEEYQVHVHTHALGVCYLDYSMRVESIEWTSKEVVLDQLLLEYQQRVVVDRTVCRCTIDVLSIDVDFSSLNISFFKEMLLTGPAAVEPLLEYESLVGNPLEAPCGIVDIHCQVQQGVHVQLEEHTSVECADMHVRVQWAQFLSSLHLHCESVCCRVKDFEFAKCPSLQVSLTRTPHTFNCISLSMSLVSLFYSPVLLTPLTSILDSPAYSSSSSRLVDFKHQLAAFYAVHDPGMLVLVPSLSVAFVDCKPALVEAFLRASYGHGLETDHGYEWSTWSVEIGGITMECLGEIISSTEIQLDPRRITVNQVQVGPLRIGHVSGDWNSLVCGEQWRVVLEKHSVDFFTSLSVLGEEVRGILARNRRVDTTSSQSSPLPSRFSSLPPSPVPSRPPPTPTTSASPVSPTPSFSPSSNTPSISMPLGLQVYFDHFHTTLCVSSMEFKDLTLELLDINVLDHEIKLPLILLSSTLIQMPSLTVGVSPSLFHLVQSMPAYYMPAYYMPASSPPPAHASRKILCGVLKVDWSDRISMTMQDMVYSAGTCELASLYLQLDQACLVSSLPKCSFGLHQGLVRMLVSVTGMHVMLSPDHDYAHVLDAYKRLFTLSTQEEYSIEKQVYCTDMHVSIQETMVVIDSFSWLLQQGEIILYTRTIIIILVNHFLITLKSSTSTIYCLHPYLASLHDSQQAK